MFPAPSGAVLPASFLNFGPGYAGARDAYVYLPATKVGTPTKLYLMRAPKAHLMDQSAYEYFAGTAAAPAWGRAAAAAKPVFADPNGVDGPDTVYDAGLRRYLLTVAHGASGTLGVFEGPAPWGPWATVDYEDRWLGMTGGDYLGVRFPTLWMADGGKTLWTVFSCWSQLGACGPYHDRYNLMRAVLTAAPGSAGRDAGAR